MNRPGGIAPELWTMFCACAGFLLDEGDSLLLEHGALTRPMTNADEAMNELLCSYRAARSVELLAW